MKRIVIILIIMLAAGLAVACGGEDKAADTHRFSEEFSEAEKVTAMDADWLFIPEGAKLLHTSARDGKLDYDFTAVGYVEINAYIKDLYTAMKKQGITPLSSRFDEATCRLTDFAELEMPEDAVENERFSGKAYEYLYKTGEKFYSLTLKYYGSAGGTYGNGKAMVTVEDVTEYTAKCYEEFNNGQK